MIKKISNYVKRQFDQEHQQLRKLSMLSRYTPGSFKYNGLHFLFPDANSFVFMYKELFKKEIYRFKTAKTKPYIIDCGANIGMSVVYAKRQYPNARIIAFEPEKKIATYLEKNLKANNIDDVEIVDKAVWKEHTVLKFISEGADANRISSINKDANGQEEVEVETVLLSEYINEEVDLLKLDIEGAEIEVVREIEPKLKHVNHLFIEYHSSPNSKQELQVILEILERNNFHYYIDAPNPEKQHPFEDNNTNDIFSFDFFLNVYGIRKK